MNSSLQKLEYQKIIDILSTYCKTYVGKALVENLVPSNNSLKVSKNLGQTTQTLNLILRYGNLPIDEFEDLTPYIKNLESYIALTPKGLLEIAKILKIASELKDYFSKATENSNQEKNENEEFEFEKITDEFALLYTNPGIYESITKSVLDENTIDDNASKTLSSLRRNRRKFEYEIKEKLNHFIHSSTYSKYLMEPIITIRNDRYVIPVKIEYKENIQGFVHDISASGSTVYIEPTSVFDLNNKINNTKLEENIEIEKILEELTKLLFPVIDLLKTSITAIGKIDFLSSKALYSKDINGTEPIINSEKFVELLKARHPLIDKNKVVPIDINIGKTFKQLLITGPNTGGKTVTLKTVGLLCLMAQSGLHIPASEKSSIYVFDNIYADIGDEQSIQESLSTFSSHMTNIIEIINQSTSKSLVLIDELGSGTDPVQGANLAISILEHFFKNDVLTISTTHYSELKQYALVTEGFENASSEFDIENLQPTYKILIGVPGKSNAFAISKKLGLSEDILARAESLLTTDNISFEEVIKNIYDDKLLIEKEKEKILKNSNQVELLRKKLETDFSDVEAKRKDIINSAKTEAQKILLSAKDEANAIIKELNNLYDSADSTALKKANKLRDDLNKDIKNNVTLSSSEESTGSLDESQISIGLEVLVKPFNMIGTVLTMPNKNGEVFVQFGSTKTNVKISNLELSTHKSDNKKETRKTSKVSSNKFNKALSVSPEINVIGQTVDEAIFVIDKYLDDCYLAGLQTARIVHGKGTGKLRKGVHEFLRTHPHVKSFRLGTYGEGEMGVTVVEFK